MFDQSHLTRAKCDGVYYSVALNLKSNSAISPLFSTPRAQHKSLVHAAVHAYLNARSCSAHLRRREERSISVALFPLSYLSSIIQISVPAPSPPTDRRSESTSGSFQRTSGATSVGRRQAWESSC